MTLKNKYLVYVLSLYEKPEHAREFYSIWAMRKENLDYIAEDAAEHLWNECDGGEWMLNEDVKIVIMSQDKTFLGKFEISIDFDPSFHAEGTE